MHLPTALAFAIGLPLSLASPLTESTNTLPSRSLCAFKKTIPNYPRNIFSPCLNDDQATFIVAQFKSILTNPDRKAAVATTELLIADGYVEESHTINTLAGFEPVDGPTFPTKALFIQDVSTAPALPSIEDLEIFHGGCNKISWRWFVKDFGQYTAKGISTFTVDPCTGQIKLAFLEFNSIAWGRDIGWTCTPPPARF